MEGILINLDTSFKQFKQLFNERLTADKVGKLDRLDTAISSRASASGQSTTHSKLNANKAVIDDVRSVVGAVKAQTDLIQFNPPTSGGTSGALAWQTQSTLSDYLITVSGSGVLRQCFMTETSDTAEMMIYIDGNTVARTYFKSFNLAEGGIRFKHYFKVLISANGSAGASNTGSVRYSYTLGD